MSTSPGPGAPIWTSSTDSFPGTSCSTAAFMGPPRVGQSVSRHAQPGQAALGDERHAPRSLAVEPGASHGHMDRLDAMDRAVDPPVGAAHVTVVAHIPDVVFEVVHTPPHAKAQAVVVAPIAEAGHGDRRPERLQVDDGLAAVGQGQIEGRPAEATGPPVVVELDGQGGDGDLDVALPGDGDLDVALPGDGDL